MTRGYKYRTPDGVPGIQRLRLWYIDCILDMPLSIGGCPGRDKIFVACDPETTPCVPLGTQFPSVK
jgi:hypothetical protein